MGIRTFLSRPGPGVAPQPVPAFEAAASTVRVPATLGAALRRATADFRRRLAAGGRNASADLAAATALRGTSGPSAPPALAVPDALAALTGLVGSEAVAALTGLVGSEAVADLAAAVDPTAPTGCVGAGTTGAGNGAPPVTGRAPVDVRPPATPGTRGKPSRPWSRLARDYLTHVLTLLPRPRPAHTTITVYITTTCGVVSERPDGSAP